MMEPEVRNLLLEFLYDHRDKHFETLDLKNNLNIYKSVINRDLRYLIQKDLIDELKGLTGGDYVVRINANGIDFIESFNSINEAIKEKDIEDEDRKILNKLEIELKNELLKTNQNKDRIKEIVNKLKEYSWIASYISVILASIR